MNTEVSTRWGHWQRTRPSGDLLHDWLVMVYNKAYGGGGVKHPHGGSIKGPHTGPWPACWGPVWQPCSHTGEVNETVVPHNRPTLCWGSVLRLRRSVLGLPQVAGVSQGPSWLGWLVCGDAAPTQEAGQHFILWHSYGETIWAHLWDEISLHSTLHHPVHLLPTVLSLINMNDNSHFYCFNGSSLRTNRPFVAQYTPIATIKRKAASVTWLLDECSQGGRVVSYYSCWWWTSEQNH